jgi:SAM-dependent methyltransferase
MSQTAYANVADLYDLFVQTTLDVPFFVKAAEGTSGEILELMAGTGRLTIPLLKAGARVTAVDNSAEMLAILREKLAGEALEATVHEMDVRQLKFDKPFDLILIPFHAFAELTTLADQQQTLAAIFAHLSKKGSFICALHNPAVRLKSVDAQLHLMGKFPLQNDGKLLIWTLQTYNPDDDVVDVTQFFEEYDAAGLMVSRRMQELRVNFVEKVNFEGLIHAAGFKVRDLYGDYSSAPFDAEKSPFMIWELGR